MSLTIRPAHAYALLAGLYIGKFTNIFSDVVITALVLYIVTPEIFTEDRLSRAKNWFWSWVRPQHVKIDLTDLATLKTLSDAQKAVLLEYQKPTMANIYSMANLPKIEVIPSPKATQVYNNEIY